MNKYVCVLSGGMDSATLAYWHKSRGDDCLCLSFDYGQKHSRELEAARTIAKALGYFHSIIRVEGVSTLLPGSSLTDPTVKTPHGHYKAPTMAKTVVPSRNAMMLSIAWGVSAANNYQGISSAVHSGDHYIYPDCRPEFISSLEVSLNLGTKGFYQGKIVVPFISLDKVEIAKTGSILKIPYEETWTCYEGGDYHCGECGACQERKEAFILAGLIDPTVYKIG